MASCALGMPRQLVEGAGGTSLDDASEIVAGVASVIKNVDINADRALSRSDLHTYWQRLGKNTGLEWSRREKRK